MTRHELPPGKKIYFLSDLHLGARYFANPRDAEKRVVAFLDRIKHDAAAIYLVGDILDYWYEYRYVVPKGFVRFFGKLAELSDAGVEIVWLIGNHDIWIFDYLPEELGIKVVDGAVECSVNGKRFFITHGDDIDDESRSFRFMRSLFRNRTCQRLYAAIHPRWTIPFALGWSRKSRQGGGNETEPATPERFVTFAKGKLKTSPDINYFIFGHLHMVYAADIAPSSRVVVLGDWITHFSYAVYDGVTLRLMIHNG